MRMLVVLLFGLRAWAGACEDIAKLEVAHVAIERAEAVTSGRFLPQTGAPLQNLPPFCRVTSIAKTSNDSEIRIEIWMPEKNWNGRLEGTGNGGFAGHIGYGALANGVKLGYAVVNTDMGMATPADSDASIFVNRPERWADWGYRATHEMTVVAKQFVRAYYDQPLKKAYFAGCSTGGEQALMEAQRFPDDYDGIVGGAPAHNRTGVHMSILWNFAVIEKDPGAYIPAAKLALISGAALAACDEKDGVKDGVISDPSKCQFDPAVLQCTDHDEPTCLTRQQMGTVRRLYAGPTNSTTKKQIYPGLPRGSEFGWDHLGPSPETAIEPPYAPIFKWAFGRQWDWRTFDFGKSAGQFENKLATNLNATSTDLDSFRRRGGKLILYHGWADWLVAPEETIRYYDDVATRDQSLTVNTSDSLRLFMIPGMAHCGGGPGADQFDPLSAMVRWVESGESPDNLVATKLTDGKPAFRRLLCPFPQIAAYRKKGDPSDDHSYACVNDSTPTGKGSK
jgi:feruloyl esterase